MSHTVQLPVDPIFRAGADSILGRLVVEKTLQYHYENLSKNSKSTRHNAEEGPSVESDPVLLLESISVAAGINEQMLLSLLHNASLLHKLVHNGGIMRLDTEILSCLDDYLSSLRRIHQQHISHWLVSSDSAMLSYGTHHSAYQNEELLWLGFYLLIINLQYGILLQIVIYQQLRKPSDADGNANQAAHTGRIRTNSKGEIIHNFHRSCRDKVVSWMLIISGTIALCDRLRQRLIRSTPLALPVQQPTTRSSSSSSSSSSDGVAAESATNNNHSSKGTATSTPSSHCSTIPLFLGNPHEDLVRMRRQVDENTADPQLHQQQQQQLWVLNSARSSSSNGCSSDDANIPKDFQQRFVSQCVESHENERNNNSNDQKQQHQQHQQHMQLQLDILVSNCNVAMQHWESLVQYIVEQETSQTFGDVTDPVSDDGMNGAADTTSSLTTPTTTTSTNMFISDFGLGSAAPLEAIKAVDKSNEWKKLHRRILSSSVIEVAKFWNSVTSPDAPQVLSEYAAAIADRMIAHQLLWVLCLYHPDASLQLQWRDGPGIRRRSQTHINTQQVKPVEEPTSSVNVSVNVNVDTSPSSSTAAVAAVEASVFASTSLSIERAAYLQSASFTAIVPVVMRLLDRYQPDLQYLGLLLCYQATLSTPSTLLASFVEWILPHLLAQAEILSTHPNTSLMLSRVLGSLFACDVHSPLVTYSMHTYLQLSLRLLTTKNPTTTAWPWLYHFNHLLSWCPVAMLTCHGGSVVEMFLHLLNTWHLPLQTECIAGLYTFVSRVYRSTSLWDTQLTPIVTELVRVWVFYHLPLPITAVGDSNNSGESRVDQYETGAKDITNANEQSRRTLEHNLIVCAKLIRACSSENMRAVCDTLSSSGYRAYRNDSSSSSDGGSSSSAGGHTSNMTTASAEGGGGGGGGGEGGNRWDNCVAEILAGIQSVSAHHQSQSQSEIKHPHTKRRQKHHQQEQEQQAISDVCQVVQAFRDSVVVQ